MISKKKTKMTKEKATNYSYQTQKIRDDIYWSKQVNFIVHVLIYNTTLFEGVQPAHPLSIENQILEILYDNKTKRD